MKHIKRLVVAALVILSVGTIVLQVPTTTEAATGVYAALGDSVAAGAGLASSDPTCKQSSLAYPTTVAVSTNLTLRNLACSGAKTDEGIYGPQKTKSATLPAQLDEAFSTGTPKLISLTIGANDARWTQFLRQCYYIRCGYGIDTGRFAVYLADLKVELNVLMAKISRYSNGTPPPVIFTGYYDPLSYDSCDDTQGLTSNEITWLKDRTWLLNNAISAVANKYSYAHYTPVDFTGHELCSGDPWVQGLTSPMPFHPTSDGQQAIAGAVTAEYATLSAQTEPRSYRERALNWYNRLSE